MRYKIFYKIQMLNYEIKDTVTCKQWNVTNANNSNN